MTLRNEVNELMNPYERKKRRLGNIGDVNRQLFLAKMAADKVEQDRRCSLARTRERYDFSLTTTSTDHEMVAGRAVPMTEFALFPLLPVELRLRIWKFALPGPRIVRLPATLLFHRVRNGENVYHQLRDACIPQNEAVKIYTHPPCHEAQEVCRSVYKKFVVPLGDSRYDSLYLIIDYDADILFVELEAVYLRLKHIPDVNKDIVAMWRWLLDSLCEVKHLAFTTEPEDWFEELESEAENWREILDHCRALKTLTYIAADDTGPKRFEKKEDGHQEWLLLNICGEERRSMSDDLSLRIEGTPTNGDGHLYEWVEGCEQIGCLNMTLVGAKRKKAFFEKIQREFSEKKKKDGGLKTDTAYSVQFNLTLKAWRKAAVDPWKVVYFMAENNFDDHGDEDGIPDHWHSEFVNFGEDRTLLSCSLYDPDGLSVACAYCGKSRWRKDWEGEAFFQDDETDDDSGPDENSGCGGCDACRG